MNLLLLAPEVQERVLVGELALSERALRRVVSEAGWAAQAALVKQLTEETLS